MYQKGAVPVGSSTWAGSRRQAAMRSALKCPMGCGVGEPEASEVVVCCTILHLLGSKSDVP